MENPTRFDLTAALEYWRAELAVQPSLTAEVRRELETHLRDALTGFRQRGLTDEEAFWLARRRVGQPAQLGDEFVKADPAAVWRERVFWMAVAFLAFNLWGNLSSSLTNRMFSNNRGDWSLTHLFPDWVVFYLPHWLTEMLSRINPDHVLWLVNWLGLVPAIWLAIRLAQGRLNSGRAAWDFISESRFRLVVIGLVSVALVNLWVVAISVPYYGSVHQSFMASFFQRLTFAGPWDLSLIAIIAWLLPSQNKKSAQPA